MNWPLDPISPAEAPGADVVGRARVVAEGLHVGAVRRSEAPGQRGEVRAPLQAQADAAAGGLLGERPAYDDLARPVVDDGLDDRDLARSRIERWGTGRLIVCVAAAATGDDAVHRRHQPPPRIPYEPAHLLLLDRWTCRSIRDRLLRRNEADADKRTRPVRAPRIASSAAD